MVFIFSSLIVNGSTRILLRFVLFAFAFAFVLLTVISHMFEAFSVSVLVVVLVEVVGEGEDNVVLKGGEEAGERFPVLLSLGIRPRC